MSWTHANGDRYVITGRKYRGGRFRMESANLAYALGINLWNGSVWAVRAGKRTLIKRVTN